MFTGSSTWLQLHLKRAAASLVRAELRKSCIVPPGAARVFRLEKQLDCIYALYGDEVRYVIVNDTVVTMVPVDQDQVQNLELCGISVPFVRERPNLLQEMHRMVQEKYGQQAEADTYAEEAEKVIEQPTVVQQTKPKAPSVVELSDDDPSWILGFGPAWTIALYEKRSTKDREEQRNIQRLLERQGLAGNLCVVFLCAYVPALDFVGGVPCLCELRCIEFPSVPIQARPRWFRHISRIIPEQVSSLTMMEPRSIRILHAALQMHGWVSEVPERLRAGMLVQHRLNEARQMIEITVLT